MNHFTNPSTLCLPKLFVAGMGAITPAGDTLPMTAAVVNAHISVCSASNYINRQGQPLITAWIADQAMNKIPIRTEQSHRFNLQYERMIKMAGIAIGQACANHSFTRPVPLVLAMPEPRDSDSLTPLSRYLEDNFKLWTSCSIHSGRAAGIEAIDFAFRYLYDLPNDFILIGASDSYQNSARLTLLENLNRLKFAGRPDGFAPGEAACFLLLTRHPELALMRNGQVIALNKPGVADEPYPINSVGSCYGEGLDQVFKKVLAGRLPNSISSVYASINGEHYWAKEYCLALARNRRAFAEQLGSEHPATCYGDAGSATAPLLIALAAEHLWQSKKATSYLVYSSSDNAKRGALVVEKIGIATR